jgi:predicted component of type VI protein secretion system
MSGSGHDKTQVLSDPPTPAAPAAPHGPRATLHCVDTSVLKDGKGAEIVLDGEPVGVGRGEENTVALNAQGVSRLHARVFLDDGVWHVEDLGSTNGTRVNNSRIERCALNDGDTVAFGRVCYKYHVARPRAERAASSHDIDLGSDEKTVVMRPGQSAAAPPAEAAAEPVAARPAVARSAADTGSHARVKPGAAKDSNSTAWLLLVLAAAAVVAGGAYALGFI